ncbi:hypothetical protein ACKWTF_008866 [Chironomus riparius]
MLRVAHIFFVCFVLTSYQTFATDPIVETYADPIIVNDVAFMKLGTYRGFTDDGTEYQKSFFVQRYSTAPWAESKAICKAFDMDLVYFETLAESRAFLNMIDTNSVLIKTYPLWIWLDGIALTGKSKTDWYWSKSGKKVTFPMDWYVNSPGSIDQFCLCIGRQTLTTKSGFNDCYCYDAYKIACQRIEFFLSSMDKNLN